MGEVASDTEPQTADPGKLSPEINGSCEEAMDVSPAPSPTTSEVKDNIDEAAKIQNAGSIDSVESESNHSNSNNSNSIPKESNDNENDVESMEEETQEDTQSEVHEDAPSEVLEDTPSETNNVQASENGDNEGPKAPEEAPTEDGILIGDSSDEEDAPPKSTNADNSDDDEPMEVDGVQNGSTNDDPVSILSDSEPEEIVDNVSKSNSVEEVKINGDTCSSPEVQEIDSDKEDDCMVTEEKTPKKKSTPSPTLLNESPRRSSRNINRKSYALDEDSNEEEDDLEEDDEEESDIEEITPMDPLSDPLAGSSRPGPKSKMRMTVSNNNTSIIIPEPERAVEIIKPQQQPQPPKTGKKSPTLVIIDTNSILSGRGPIPMTSKAPTQNFSVMPVALPAQGVYPANMRATITPVPPVSVTRAPQPIILPSLTDDMFVVEAPSFIVPYVYEKPPMQPFKEFVEKLGKEVEELRLKEEKEKQEKEKEKEKDKETKGDSGDKSGEEDGKDDEQISEENDSNKKKKKKKRKHGEDDESWDGSEHSSESDDDNSDEEIEKKEIIVKEMKEDALDAIKEHIITPETAAAAAASKQPEKKSDSYFENPLGKFFMSIGINLVQEHVQTDLLKQQKRKFDREGKGKNSDTQMAIKSLVKNLEFSKENNEPFRFEQKKCEFCNFKTESSLAMEHHMETPHMRNYVYRCNFCPFEIRSPHDILFHMEAEHNTRGRLERGPAYHQCPNCPFEDNGKGKLTRHLIACAKKYKPEVNLGPPGDWEPPAKIPRTSRPKQSLSAAASAFQAMQGARASNAASRAAAAQRARGNNRPQVIPKQTSVIPQNIIRGGVMYRQAGTSSNPVLVPTSYQYSGNQLIQVVGSSVAMLPSAVASGSGTVTIQTSTTTTKAGSKLVHQPSISITPLPRQPATTITPTNTQSIAAGLKPGQQPSGKTSFVICEICDGYIKDLDQLRNHMQWIHKVKIHPKMIYNRPPLNCQKCQFRFFTDQGLERHLLGSHGLVTSSMQEAANKGKDAGRCPVCGRVYQWKLLNHVARDHNMTLKPAHLSYKCTVCTATFGMYKQFENHVYSAHSVVAKKVIDKKPSPATKTGGDSLLKPLKINDEITIIPQPAKARPGPASRTASPARGPPTKGAYTLRS